MVRRLGSVTVPGLVIGVQLLALCGCGGANPNGFDGASRGFRSSPLRWLGSTQTIASTRVPGGPAFSIVGSRYRFWGQDHLQISVQFADPWRVADAGWTSGWGEGGVTGYSQRLDEELQVTTGCQVHRFTIVHGLLKRSGDVVFAQMAGRTSHMVRLDQVALPDSLHSSAVLVYGTMLVAAPAGFVLRTRTGDWIHLNRLSTGRTTPAGCAGRERAWVQAHFSRAQADQALADITHCLRGKGFEVGAPDYTEFGEFGQRSRWRQLKAAQQACRAQAAATA